MTYKVHLDSRQAKTGKASDDFRRVAQEKGREKYGEVLKWLKTDFGLDHDRAHAVILHIQDPEHTRRKISEDAKRTK
jgi:hypothetical protein